VANPQVIGAITDWLTVPEADSSVASRGESPRAIERAAHNV
jgi:hypothetical protein